MIINVVVLHCLIVLLIIKGDEEGGGGSDIGRFLGGLIGAFIKGVAQPPGAVSISME